MAITYKIYESGFNKVIDVLNDGSVIGKKKFIPKAAVAVQDGNIKIKDVVTNSLEFEGSFESFVDSEGNNFGSVEAINDFLSSIPINLYELRGIELIDGALAQDLSSYATIEYVDDEIVGEGLARDAAIQVLKDYVDEQIAALQAQIDSLDTRIVTVEEDVEVMPKTLYHGDPFNFTQTTSVDDSEPVYVNASTLTTTFTTTETGKVAIIMENVTLSYNDSGARTWMYITTTDPTPFGSGNIIIDKYTDEQAYALDWFEDLVDNGQVNVVQGQITFGNFLSSTTGGDPILVNKDFSIQMTLEPNTQYTYYFWMVPVVWGLGNPRIAASVSNGIKVMEVLDI